ncbi:MAG: hypothetical protein MZU91_11105 [Desulfosudis oleivorans]|nr:hypothetical protein [Desulfosudis oleivorans]
MKVASPDRPELAASLTASGYARSVSVSGKLLGVGSLYDGGYQILDISDPAAPAVVSTNKYTMYNEGWRVVLDGNRGLVVDYFSGLFFVDLADPSKPKPTARVPAPSSIVAVCGRGSHGVRGRRALRRPGRGCGRPVQAGTRRRDEHLPRRPGHRRRTATTSTSPTAGRSRSSMSRTRPSPRAGKPLIFSEGIPRTLVVRGNDAFLTADNFGFYTLDVTDPAVPKVAGSFKLPGFTYGLAVAGERAYLANSDTGLHVLDIRKPAAPVEIGAARLPGEPTGLAVRGRFAYVASGAEGLVVVDVGEPGAARVLGTAASDDFSSAVALDGDFAYVADGLAGVKKIDVSDPASPRLVSSYDTPGEAQNLFVLGKTILVADTYSLVLLK